MAEIRAVQVEMQDRPGAGITNAARVCAKCGGTVFVDAPGAFCSVCLLRTGLGLFEENLVDLETVSQPAGWMQNLATMSCLKKSAAADRAWSIAPARKVLIARSH